MIKGTIANYSALDPATVALYAQDDTTFVKKGVVEANGSFWLSNDTAGNYLLGIKVSGYSDHWEPLDFLGAGARSVDLGIIDLISEQHDLNGVVVKASKPFLQRRSDRLIVNPDALISNNGGSVLEVLEQTPGVAIGANGHISLKGRYGVQVFVDDKPTYLTNDELVNYLRSLPASTIDNIELMADPSSKYEAEGSAGIINIKLKKSVKKGFTVALDAAYSRGRYAKTQNSFNLNYRLNKMNVFANIGISNSKIFQDLTIDRYYFDTATMPLSSFHQNSLIKKTTAGNNLRIGMDYYATNRSIFGIVVSGFLDPETGTVDNSALILDKWISPEAKVLSHRSSQKKWKNGAVNLNYQYKFNEKGHELLANAAYVAYRSGLFQNLTNNVYSADGSFLERSVLEFEFPAHLRIASAKLDYLHPLADAKIESGVKWSWAKTDADARVYDNIGGSRMANNEFTNRFRYHENIMAGYINYIYNAPKLSLQAGLRLEYTNADGHQAGNVTRSDSVFSFNYINFFPTGFALYKFDTLATHQLSLSLGRRISRPDYHYLNPFTFPIDRYTYYTGNPYLRPAFSYGAELSYTYKNMITTSLEYSFVNDLINETNEQQGNIYYSRPGNLGDHNVWGFTITGSLPIVKWWTLQLHTEVKNASFNTIIYGQLLDEQRWYGYFGPVNQFKITENWKAELSGSYQSPTLVGQFLTIPVWQAKAAMSYTILNGNGTFRISLADIFYSNQPGGAIRNIANARADWRSRLDTRILGFGFAYRFSQGEAIQARRSGAADTEKGRVKV